MQLLNLALYGVLLLVQCAYTFQWILDKKGIVPVSILRIAVELSVEVVLLFLMTQFGSNVTVKSFVHSNGDLVILGTD